MRLPSRWVTNPGSTLKAKSGPHSEVRSFFVPADMGRGCIGHPPAQGTGPPVPAEGGRQASARLRAEENASFLSHPHTLRAPQGRAADRQGHVRKRRRIHERGKAPKKGGERCRRDGAGERRCRGETMQGRRCSTPGKSRTAHPRNKNHGLPENHDLPGKPGSPGKPRLLPEKPRPARIRKKTPAGRCRE